MMTESGLPTGNRDASYGEIGLTLVDRFGVYLSKRQILRNLLKTAQLSVLDLGCGYHATHLRALYPHLESGTGVDVRIDSGCKRIPRLTFIETAVEAALPSLPSLAFDLVMLISVLEHLENPLSVLQECHRTLQADGVLMINVPTWRGKRFLEFSAFRLGLSPACEMDEHKMYYELRDLWPLLVQAGFKPSNIKLKYHKFGMNLFGTIKK